MISTTLEDYLNLIFAKQSPMVNFVAIGTKRLAVIVADPEHSLHVYYELSENSPLLNDPIRDQVYKLYRKDVWLEEYKVRQKRIDREIQERSVNLKKAELRSKIVSKLQQFGMNYEGATTFMEISLKNGKPDLLVGLGFTKEELETLK